MNVDISCNPAYTLATMQLSVDEAVFVESGAMVAMSTGIEVTGAFGSGNLLTAAMRKFANKESLLVGEYKAKLHNAWVAIAPKFPGDIITVDANEDVALFVQPGSFLASNKSVQSNVSVNGIQPIMLREGLTALAVRGQGKAILASYGAITSFVLQPDQEIIVDTGHLVAWDETINMQVGMLGNVITAAVTGEGLVGKLRGPGRVFIQTRSEQPFREWLFPNQSMNVPNKK